MGIFGFCALVGLVVFAMFRGGSSVTGIGTVVVWGTLPRDQISSMVASVQQIEDSIKGVSYVQKDPQTLAADLAAAIATNTGPDLVLASQEELHTLSKFLMPIPTDVLSARDFADTFINEGRLLVAPRDSGFYGIPFLVDPLVLFSNTDILSSSGIARPPTTWEGLIGLVSNVAVLSPTKQITRGLIAFGTYDNVHNARGILSALFLQNEVAISGRTSSGSLVADLGKSETGNSQSGQEVLRFYTLFADPSKVSYTWNSSLPDSQRAFQTGDLALYVGYASEVRFFTAANRNLNFNVSPLPQIDVKSNKTTYGLLYSFMIPRGAKNPSGAYQAVALLTGPAEQAIAAKATGLAPATTAALATPPSDDAVASVAYASALYARGWLSPMPADTDTVFSGMIGNIVTGRLSPEAALSRASGALTSLLQK